MSTWTGCWTHLAIACTIVSNLEKGPTNEHIWPLRYHKCEKLGVSELQKEIEMGLRLAQCKVICLGDKRPLCLAYQGILLKSHWCKGRQLEHYSEQMLSFLFPAIAVAISHRDSYLMQCISPSMIVKGIFCQLEPLLLPPLLLVPYNCSVVDIVIVRDYANKIRIIRLGTPSLDG